MSDLQAESPSSWARLIVGWSLLTLGVITLIGAEQLAEALQLPPWQLSGRAVAAPVPVALLAVAAGALLVRFWTRALRRRYRGG
jgi:hypothetical protein